MKRFVSIAALFMILFAFMGKASAQTLSDRTDMRGRIVYGGNVGGGLSGNYLNISLAPQLGYRILSPWEVGLRGVYDLQCRFDRVNGNTYSHYFGVAPYTNVEVFRGIFLHVEDEVMYGISRWNHQTSNRRWYNSLFVGGGYRQYTYEGSFVYFMILYNLSWQVLENPNGWGTPYSSPFIIRVGYCF